MRNHEDIRTVESLRVWTVDPTPFRSFRYRDMERQETLPWECRNPEMPKCETRFGSICGRSHWSHRRKMKEGASSDKLHFGVSGIGTWSVMKSLPRGSRNAEVRNGEVNASFYEFNPTVQVKLNKIAGLLLRLAV
jgi:hypothetical protein